MQRIETRTRPPLRTAASNTVPSVLREPPRTTAERSPGNKAQQILSRYLPSIVVDFVLGIRPISTVKFIAWLLLYYVFIQLEFGAVFFITSCFYFIWTNMGTRDKTQPKFEEQLRQGDLAGGF